MLKLKKEPLKQQLYLFCFVGFCFVLFFKYRNWLLCKLGRAWGCSGPQSQSCAAAITVFVGGSGQAPGRSQTAEFPLSLQYLNFLEIAITPASKSSPWSAERILLYCCLSSSTLGAILFTVSGWGWTASQPKRALWCAFLKLFMPFLQRLLFNPPSFLVILCLLNYFALKRD